MEKSKITHRQYPLGRLAATLAAFGAAAMTGSPAQAQQPAERDGNSPLDIVVTDPHISSSRRLRPGDTVKVTLTLRNQGPLVARSQGPAPKTVYTQGETYSQKGFASPDPNRYSVVMTLSGPRGHQWPYRWGLGGDLKLGEIRRVSYPIELTEPGLYTVYVGIATGDRVAQASLGRLTGVEVAAYGKPFRIRPDSRMVPPPARITVNGREIETDQRPIFYKSQITASNVQIMAPIRPIAEAIGAEVRWDRETGTAHIWDGTKQLTLRPGGTRHSLNGTDVYSHAPLRLMNGRTMVPVRFISEQMGATVNWDGPTRTVGITVPQTRQTVRRQ
jgi:hypothetical protein